MKRYRSTLLAAAAALSAGALLVERALDPYERLPYHGEMSGAAGILAAAEARVRDARIASGIPPDPVHDPNGTGMIGREYSVTTTTLGDLAAKRTGANPDAAALLVRLLREAGVRRGDAVAMGASGSFPSLILAVLSAARALDLDVGLIVSLGSSSWGANVPGFSYLRMHEAALPELGYGILGVSLGGSGDSGAGMLEEGRELLEAEMDASGLTVLAEATLDASVRARMALYGSFLGCRRYTAFVNVGGASANVGEGAPVLELKPGVNLSLPPAPKEKRGVAHEMASRGVPVIHLLNIRELAAEYGLPWDPAPFPAAGVSQVYHIRDRGLYRRRLLCLAAFYFAALGLLAVLYRRADSDSRRPRPPE